MEYIDREGNVIIANDAQEKVLKFLYETQLGRNILKILIAPQISKIGGLVLDTKISKLAIASFVKKNHINLQEYQKQTFNSYNDFFIRKIRKNMRPFPLNKTLFVSPCDSKLSIYKIKQRGRFVIKNSEYTIESILRDKGLAKRFYGGFAMIFRLTVDDYHHYCYVDNGKKSNNRKISGVLHTVNPIAGERIPIYKENSREYSLLKSDHFGTIIMMEVGALMVGKIVNLHEKADVKRGEEKGYFEFGGSTVILFVQKDQVLIDEDIMINSIYGIETKVKMGETIGKKAALS